MNSLPRHYNGISISPALHSAQTYAVCSLIISTAHKARQAPKEDFPTFDYILCLDESNIRKLERTVIKLNTAKIGSGEMAQW